MDHVNLNNANELPSPTLTRTIEIDSDHVQSIQAGLVHIIKLPKIGEYAYDFKIYSNIVLLGKTNIQDNIQNMDISMGVNSNLFNYGCPPPPPPPPSSLSQNTSHNVDCILNYIESVALTIDSPETPLSHLQNNEYVDRLGEHELVTLVGRNLDFIYDAPILTGSLYNSDIYVVIKFNKKPSMKYYLSYDIGFIADAIICQQFHDYTITFPGTITHNGTQHFVQMKYHDGKLHI